MAIVHGRIQIKFKSCPSAYQQQVAIVPLAYCINMKETCENMSYDKSKWNICADLKVIALLLGLQLGYTKFYILN